jgi:hypothetical protein
MRRAPTFTNHTSLALLASFVVASVFERSEAPEVTFVSPCECQGFHGKNRWIAKTDLSPVSSDKSAIQSVTPSQIYSWEGPGPDVDLTGYTEARMPSEQKWYALTGRVVDAKVEADGDIHIALQGTLRAGRQAREVEPENAGPSYVIGPPAPLRADAFPEYVIIARMALREIRAGQFEAS